MMNRSFSALALSIAVSFVVTIPAVANAATSGQMTTQVAATETKATAALNELLAKISSLQANFNQTTKATATNKPVIQHRQLGLKSSHLGQTFSGVMQVKRQGLFRWETINPMKQLIMTSGKTVWIYDPDLQQATRQTLDAQMSNTPALLLSGNASQIMKSYKVTQPNDAIPYFVLYPRIKDGVFESLAIRFDANVPVQMVLSDSLGQQTTVNFTDIKLNPSIPSSQFEFTPPKGADVIDQ
jgi:outer membrane lipoprotein carrier protein